MKRVVTSADVKQLGTILSVWAHPDDETMLAGGIMAAAVANGQTVACVTATKGEAGVQDEHRWPASKLGDIRAAELSAALHELGVSDHHWLPYRDGKCDSVDQTEAARKIATLIDQYQPDTILTFGPEGLTGHPDHRSVSRWVQAAVRLKTPPPKVYRAVIEINQYKQHLRQLDEQVNLFFNIDKPPLVEVGQCDIAFRLPPEVLARKWRALAAMPSQMERLLALIPEGERSATVGQEYFVLV